MQIKIYYKDGSIRTFAPNVMGFSPDIRHSDHKLDLSDLNGTGVVMRSRFTNSDGEFYCDNGAAIEDDEAGVVVIDPEEYPEIVVVLADGEPILEADEGGKLVPTAIKGLPAMEDDEMDFAPEFVEPNFD